MSAAKRRVVGGAGGMVLAAIVAACGGGDADAPNAAATTNDSTAHILAVTPQQAALATWSAPVTLSLVPVSGTVLSTGKLLLWASDAVNNETYSGGGHAQTTIFDPATGTATPRDVADTQHDMFCPGTARLADGRLLVNGGYNAAVTSLYDPVANTWTRGPDMLNPRGYNADTPLADGSVLTFGGSWSGTQTDKPAEVYTPGGGWRALSGVTTANTAFRTGDPAGLYRQDNHMWLIPTGNGLVLHAGPAKSMNWIDTRGNGTASAAGPRGADTDSMNGNAVMYDAGKILALGGAPNYENSDAKSSAFVIDTTGGAAAARPVASMAYARAFHNSVVLPNGQVVVLGGQTRPKPFSDDNAILPAELWDPQTERFTTLPAMSVPRTYHSIGLLLPDGRVVSGGGGLCACSADHANLQILTPPYLYNADGSAATRPVIKSAPAQLAYGGSATVTTDSAVTAFSLVRLGAATHTVNNDQRRIPVGFTAGANNSYQLAVPTNPGLLLPGQWMLFAMNANGTPSVAAIMTVGLTGAPVLQNPGTLTTTPGAAVSLALSATTPQGTLAWSATGLPTGLTLDPATGVVSGTVATPGRYLVTVAAGNGTATVSTDVVIRVEAPAGGTGLAAQYYANTTLAGTVAATSTEVPRWDLGAACAVDGGGSCTVTAPTLLNFGSSGANFVTKVVNSGTFSCDYGSLGDPAPGQAKKCYLGVSGAPAAAGPYNFSARWTGAVEAVATGSTLFSVKSAGGVRVWIGQKLVIDDWTPHAPTTDTAALDLVAGRRYPLTIEAAQAVNVPLLQLSWQPAGDVLAPIPAARLYPGPAPASTNLARGKTATQTSTDYGGAASRAVDGSTDGVFNDGSVSHTAGAAPQDAWQVDLGAKLRVDLAQLWNRSDCCTDRLGNFWVFVADTDMSGRTVEQLKADPAVTARQVAGSAVGVDIGVPIGVAGRYLKVQLAGTGILSLAEVVVLGDTTVYPVPTIAAITDPRTALGAGVSLAVVASDTAGDALSYTATGLPAGLAIDPQRGTITGTPTTPGSSAVTVTATNPGLLSASTTFTWTVTGGVPQVVALPAPVAVAGSTVAYAPVLGSGASTTFSWNFGDGSADTAYAATAATTHAFTAAGVYTVSLTLRTADGTSATTRFLQAIYPSGATALGRASASLLLEPRPGAAARLWAANPDADTVSVFDTGTNAKLAEIAVGAGPRTLALAGDGRVWVANHEGASLSVVSPATLAVVQTVALPRASQPFGVVANPSSTDKSVYVALEASGQVLKLDASGGTTSGATLATQAVGDRPRHLAITAAADRLLVSRYITRPLPGEGTATVSTTDANGAKLGGEVLVLASATLALQSTTVLAHSERTDAENQGRGIPNYLGAAALSPDGKTAWVPSKQDNIKRGTARDGLALNFQSTVRSISSRIDLATGAEDLAGRIDHDNSGVASAAVYHPTGAYLFVALETTRQVAVVDAAGKRELFRYDAGLAPQGLAVSADGLKLYVDNYMDRTVGVIDLTPLVGFGQAGLVSTATLGRVATEKLSATVLRGKQLFYDAKDPRLARDGYLSCASCHNDAGHDGRTWDFTNLGEGLRNTIPLKGRAGTGQGFLHWSANFDEVQDFEGQIRAFAGGSGLMADADYNTGTRNQPLGDRKAGLSADLDALAAYLGSLSTFAPSPYRAADGTLTAAAQAGRLVFSGNCASCHAGAGFTASGDASQLKDIGTLKATSGKRLGATLPGIDIPTLRDVWATAPYLHDGSAPTLATAVGAHRGITLNATDLANTVAYLQQIGAEEPAPPVDLALGRAATQSSTVTDGDPAHAVDGRTDGDFGHLSVSHTGLSAQPWWQVDLGASQTVATVRLWNRTDCCVDRLANGTVFLSATDMTGRSYTQLKADSSVVKASFTSLNGASSLALALAGKGRYVRVQLSGTDYLSLAAVQVFGP